MATVPEIIAARGSRGFSIEVLPPLKGRGIGRLFAAIDPLMEYAPLYVNITTHRSEQVYKSTPDGLYRRVVERSRPGTVAVAAALQQRYGLPAVPHLICSGFSRRETEYALIDLEFLGINNLLVLRGDKAKHESRFTPDPDGYAHASELQAQIEAWNAGLFLDGTEREMAGDTTPFAYGVAGYPEKHDESPNAEMDMHYLKAKVDGGAGYVVTQMFFDNARYFDFVARARQAGITVPIVPGIKPIVSRAQLTLLPRVFHTDIPTDLAHELMTAKDDVAAKEIGVEWAKAQVRQLYDSGVPSVHFYSLNATESVRKIVSQI